jgi:hypothetical protein
MGHMGRVIACIYCSRPCLDTFTYTFVWLFPPLCSGLASLQLASTNIWCPLCSMPENNPEDWASVSSDQEMKLTNSSRRPWSLIIHWIWHQFKSSTSFRRSHRHPMPSLATRDTLEVPHADPRAWRGVIVAVSHRGTVPTVQDPRVRILVSTASIWARKPELSCPVAPGAKLRRGRRRPWRVAPTHRVSQGPFIREFVARIRSCCTRSCVLIWTIDPQSDGSSLMKPWTGVVHPDHGPST